LEASWTAQRHVEKALSTDTAVTITIPPVNPVSNQNSDILEDLTAALPDGQPEEVCIGLHWTAVVMQVENQKRCGLAATLQGEHDHKQPDVPLAGSLDSLDSARMADLSLSDSPTLVSVGMAAINALLPRQPDRWVVQNAEHLIAEHGAGKPVALVGHFPFVDRLRDRVGELNVLELNPRAGDLPVSEAGRIIPEARVVALTGMSLLNHTLEGLLSLCAPDALVILLGPSVPLHDCLFDRGVDVLCGSVVTEIDKVLSAVCQGADFRQVHRAGVRLVTMTGNG
jgi:hypothetical protein